MSSSDPPAQPVTEPLEPDTPRLLVFGGRHFKDRAKLFADLDALRAKSPRGLAIISGAAPGADTLAWEWAVERDVFWVLHPADWDKHPRAGGVLRNQAMLEQWRPHRYLGYPGGRGSQDMFGRLVNAGVPRARVKP